MGRGSVAVFASALVGCAQLLELDVYQSGGSGGTAVAGPPPGEVLWAKLYGDDKAQTPHALGVSDDGAVLFAGALEGRLDVGCCDPLVPSDDEDPFVAALDIDGAGLWGTVLAASSAASIDGFWPVGGSIWFSGSFDADIDVDGTALTATDLDAFFGALAAREGVVTSAEGIAVLEAQRHTRIALDRFSRAAIAGETLAAAGTDVWVRTFQDNGAMRWEKTFGATGDDELHAIAVDSNGDVIVAGSIGGIADFGCQAHRPIDVDGFVVKLEYLTGDCLWSLALGGSGAQRVRSASVDDAGNVLVAGEFEDQIHFGGEVVDAQPGTIDAFIAMLDRDGDYLWHQTSAGVGDERAAQAIFTTGGRIAVAGEFSEELGFDARTVSDDLLDGFVLVLEADGALRWSAQLAGGGHQRFVSVGSQGERVFALGELSGDGKLGGWFLVNGGIVPSIAVAAFIE